MSPLFVFEKEKEAELAKKLEETIAGLVQDKIEQLGYELDDVEYEKKHNMDSELIIYIDKEGGINLDDCEKVSTEIDPIIDAKCPLTDPYVLVVSSPGIDRPFKKEKDYIKNIGEKVDIKLYEKLNGKKDMVAVLKEYTPEEITVEDEKGKEIKLSIGKIALIRAHIDFNSLK